MNFKYFYLNKYNIRNTMATISFEIDQWDIDVFERLTESQWKFFVEMANDELQEKFYGMVLQEFDFRIDNDCFELDDNDCFELEEPNDVSKYVMCEDCKIDIDLRKENIYSCKPNCPKPRNRLVNYEIGMKDSFLLCEECTEKLDYYKMHDNGELEYRIDYDTEITAGPDYDQPDHGDAEA